MAFSTKHSIVFIIGVLVVLVIVTLASSLWLGTRVVKLQNQTQTLQHKLVTQKAALTQAQQQLRSTPGQRHGAAKNMPAMGENWELNIRQARLPASVVTLKPPPTAPPAAARNSPLPRQWPGSTIPVQRQRQPHLPPAKTHLALPAPGLTDVDAVICWADAAHPKWADTYNHYAELYGQHYDRERFQSPDELKFALRSLSQNAPWLRRIVVVTTFGDCPPWIDPVAAAAAHPPIHFISNAEILPDKAAMPVAFNSIALQLSLDAIPNLAPWLLLLDDDCYLLKPVPKSKFLRERVAGYSESSPSAPPALPQPLPPSLVEARNAAVAVNYANLQGNGTPPHLPAYIQRPETIGGWAAILCHNYVALGKSLSPAMHAWINADPKTRRYLLPNHNMTMLPRDLWAYARQLQPLGTAMAVAQRAMFRATHQVSWWPLTMLSFLLGTSVREQSKDSAYMNWPDGKARNGWLQHGFGAHIWQACINNFNGDAPDDLRRGLERMVPWRQAWEL